MSNNTFAELLSNLKFLSKIKKIKKSMLEICLYKRIIGQHQYQELYIK